MSNGVINVFIHVDTDGDSKTLFEIRGCQAPPEHPRAPVDPSTTRTVAAPDRPFRRSTLVIYYYGSARCTTAAVRPLREIVGSDKPPAVARSTGAPGGVRPADKRKRLVFRYRFGFRNKTAVTLLFT